MHDQRSQMNITLLTYGSRGDVEPFLALADALTASGWQVHLAAPEAYHSLLANPLVRFTGLPGSPSEIVRRLEHVSCRGLHRTIGTMMDFVQPIAIEVLEKARLASADADVLVHSFLLTIAGSEIARERGIPHLSAQFFPVFAPTRSFSAPNMPGLPAGVLSLLSHGLLSRIFWHGSRLAYRRLQRSHSGLRDLTSWPFAARNPSPPPLLFAFSPQVIPRPHDWGRHVHITGYWINEQLPDFHPAPGLMQFLDAGPPPVCLGAGSSSNKTTARLARAFVHACRTMGMRGVVVGGNALKDLSDSILQVDTVPYSWLFPRCAAVVHHGGAGTTAAALRAGIPNVVLPITSDQPFWARRVHALGAGPAPIPAGRVTPEKLASSLHTALTDTDIRRKAARLGRSLRKEDGVQRAVEWIESTVLHNA